MKSAPLRNSDRASATAAYEHDDDAAPSPVAVARLRGRSSGSSRAIVDLRTSASITADSVKPRISDQVTCHVIDPATRERVQHGVPGGVHANPSSARIQLPHGGILLPGYRALRGGIVYGYTQNKDDYLKRLRRIEGQVRGIARMVEDDKYCIDILTQVSAATKALQSVALGLLQEHLAGCVVDAARVGGPDADAKVAEAADAIARLVRS